VIDQPGQDPGARHDVAVRTAWNAVVMAGAEVAGKVGTLVFTVLAARMLTEAEFGAFAYALSVSLLVATVPSWGFDALVVQRGSRDLEQLPSLFARALVAKAVMGLPSFILVGILVGTARPTREAVVALALVLAATFLDAFSDASRAVATAVQRLGGVSSALTMQRFLVAAFAAVFLFSGGRLVAASLAYFLGAVGGLVGSVVAVRRLGVRPAFRGVRPRHLWELGRHSWALGTATVIGMMLFRIDAVMLQAWQGDEAVAVYSVAYRLLETVLFLAWSVSNASFPAMSAEVDTARIRESLEQVSAILAAAYVAFAVVALIEAPGVLGLLFGETYAEQSTPVLRWLSVAPLVWGVYYLCQFGLLARDRQGRLLVAVALATALNLVLNAVLIPDYAGVGAAIATTVSYAVGAAAMLAMLRSVTGLPAVGRTLVEPLSAGAVMAATMVLLPGPTVVVVPVGAVVYLAVWFVLARWRSPELVRVVQALVRGERA
jgi:O-antigen/teichoic acid export membrane protein